MIFQKELTISLASTSKHIQVLARCGTIVQKKVGTERICQMNFNKLADASIWLGSVGLLDLLDVSRLEAFLTREALI